MAEITVRLLAGDDGEDSRKMLRDFSSDIARLEGVKPSTEAATRGDPVTLGMIVLAHHGNHIVETLRHLHSHRVVGLLNRAGEGRPWCFHQGFARLLPGGRQGRQGESHNH